MLLLDAMTIVQIKAFRMFVPGQGIPYATCVATARQEKQQLAPSEPRIDATPSGHPEISTSLEKSSALVRVLDMTKKLMTINPTGMTFRSNKAFDSFRSICSKHAKKHVVY